MSHGLTSTALALSRFTADAEVRYRWMLWIETHPMQNNLISLKLTDNYGDFCSMLFRLPWGVDIDLGGLTVTRGIQINGQKPPTEPPPEWSVYSISSLCLTGSMKLRLGVLFIHTM